MVTTLQTLHSNLGYLVVVVVLVAGVLALRAVEGPPVSRVSSLTMVLLDVHVTLGIVLYVAGSYWTRGTSDPLLAYAHPLLALAALGVGHAALARARREESARVAGRGLLIALGLVVAAVGVASV
jgi:hypothetical protein